MASDILEAQDIGLKVRESSTILVLTPTPHPIDINLCNDLLAVRPPAEINVWCLGITVSPVARAWHWNERIGEPPARFRMVATGDSSDPRHPDSDDLQETFPEVITISDPGNLTKIGIDLTNTLAEWDDSTEHSMVCVQSITALTQYAPFGRVFKFLHEMKDKVDQANAVAHCHMDPNAHDDQSIAQIKQVFDTVVSVDNENNWRVTTREFEAEGTGVIPTLDELDQDPLGTNPETSAADPVDSDPTSTTG